MKEVFIVSFVKVLSNESYVDSVWENEEDAEKWVNEMNEWERSENGCGDLWYIVKSEYHAK